MILIYLFKTFRQLLHIFRRQLRIILHAFRFFHFIYNLFKKRFRNFHHYIRVHLYKSAVRIICKSGIARFLRKPLYRRIVQTKIQNGIHHTGHGRSRAGPDRNQKGILYIAEFFPLLFL